MLAKITRGNQVTIPKEIVKKAHLTEGSPYLDVEYENGVIFLKPVTVEERIPPEQFEKLQVRALKKEKGEVEFESLREGIRYLKRRMKKA